MTTLPTASEVGKALAHLENYRVLRVQEICYPYDPISASVMLALGFRETGLQNIVGGAVEEDGKWVFSDQDAGWLQISRKYENDFLKGAEGCKSGQWGPAKPAHSAAELGYVPRFTPALLHTKATMLDDMSFARSNGVPQQDLLRFAIVAHNAGAGGALEGYRAGNFDLRTAHGDYSAYVLGTVPLIHNWIAAHPNWGYHKPKSVR
jgi:hypothetical protein